MTTVVLFHSAYGLRSAVLAAAGRFRQAGHAVVTPDLYYGRVAETLDEGFTLAEWIGWPTIAERARAVLRGLPEDTVLGGFSMGASIAGGLLAERPNAAGVLFLHGTGAVPNNVRPGLPMQLHVADPDAYATPDKVAGWVRDAAVAKAEAFTYPGVGHLFTDEDLPDYDERAAELVWRRCVDFLAGL
jgi:dienelactone hydrolase